MVVGLSGAPDSTRLDIRPIEAGDEADLASAVELSSGEAVYRRFLGPHGPLTAAELRYLTEVDRFTALMLAHNRPMRQLLADLGPNRVLSTGAGAVELAVDLSREQPTARS